MAGAVAAEKLDRVFRSAAQVEDATGVGVLGMVPEVKGAAAQRSNVVTHVLEDNDVAGGAKQSAQGSPPSSLGASIGRRASSPSPPRRLERGRDDFGRCLG